MHLKKTILKQLKPDEAVVSLIHGAWFAKIWQISSLTVLYFTVIFCLPLFGQYGKIGLVILLITVALIVFFSLRLFHLWYLNVMIITPQRLIVLQQIGLFHRVVQDLPWSKISHVTYQQHGLLATIGQFGTVHVISDRSEPLTVANMPQPQQLRDRIMDYAQTPPLYE